ncbi:xylose isomerase-like protein [Lophiostoma macrostomum CBS 122681]|uniref:Xylose isomerase-like protein n=1 Tax=Lophiostoma macrostomum CBS 122681 TaxID=1314788 RepID=A0A6A6T1D7_9PLEO|nr:xylose isomerase-like protein [Lophiostoma macrostomum CBS 122681]
MAGYQGFNNKLAISTSCLGLHPCHDLAEKLLAAASHGFQGIEIVYGDLERYSDGRKISLTAGAEQIRTICRDAGLEILSLCPLENFEGTKTPIADRLEVAKHWIEIARILQAPYVQCPAQYGKDVIGDEVLIVSELQQLADLGSAAEPVVAIAYEPMSWSTHYSTWQAAVRLAELVDRENFRICMDTFHIASLIYGSPHSVDGLRPNGPQNLADDLHSFVSSFPTERLAYVQLSDGERWDTPFSKEHSWYVDGWDPEMCWSGSGRPFPVETDFGGYFPVAEMVRKWIVEKGFKGWVSMETFDRRMRDEAYEIEDAAKRAEASIQRLKKAVVQEQSLL